jgi:GT2 family glycosyltransferase
MGCVSVHIVTYNNAGTVAICLEALLAQRNVDFQVRVIDNASSDDTVHRVKQLGLDVVCNQTNIGYGAAHNQAIALTDSKYVLTLNPDVRLEPNYIEALAAALEANHYIGSASGCLLRVDRLSDVPTSVDSTGLLMRRNRHQGLRYEGFPVDRRPTQPTAIFGPDGAAAFYRRAMLEDIRLLDEVFDHDFFIQKEDIDICWRAQLRGWSSVCVPHATARHIRTFRPGQRGPVTTEMRFYGIRNRYLLMIKNDIPAHFWRDILPIAAYDALIVTYIALCERESWSAIPSALALLGKMLKKRRVIQSRRQVEWQQLRQWFQPEVP